MLSRLYLSSWGGDRRFGGLREILSLLSGYLYSNAIDIVIGLIMINFHCGHDTLLVLFWIGILGCGGLFRRSV